MAAPTPQNVTVQILALLGAAGVANAEIANYSDVATTASFIGQSQVNLAANTNNQAVNLATLFPGIANAAWLVIQDTSSPGVALDLQIVGGAVLHLAANGILIVKLKSGMPTLTFNNTDPANAANLQIGVLGT